MVYKASMRKPNAYNLQLKEQGKKRAKQVVKLRAAGLTWDAIGKKLSISRQRAHQIGSKAEG